MAALTTLRRHLASSIGRKPAPLNSTLNKIITGHLFRRDSHSAVLSRSESFEGLTSRQTVAQLRYSNPFCMIDPLANVSSGFLMAGDTRTPRGIRNEGGAEFFRPVHEVRFEGVFFCGGQLMEGIVRELFHGEHFWTVWN